MMKIIANYSTRLLICLSLLFASHGFARNGSIQEEAAKLNWDTQVLQEFFNKKFTLDFKLNVIQEFLDQNLEELSQTLWMQKQWQLIKEKCVQQGLNPMQCTITMKPFPGRDPERLQMLEEVIGQDNLAVIKHRLEEKYQ